MLGKELKHLSRKELVDIIYQLKKNEDEMKEEIETLKKELEDKHFRLSAAGSIADASVAVTDLLATAQRTADIYLREIEELRAKTEEEYAKMHGDSKEQKEEIPEEVTEENPVGTPEEIPEEVTEEPEKEVPKEEPTEILKEAEDIFAKLDAMKRMLNNESCEDTKDA
ncbi:MAG: hypothetical protein IJ944_01375 [Clostridia bacterium]|nr:hypothetical protein [Clostridia bacterium]